MVSEKVRSDFLSVVPTGSCRQEKGDLTVGTVWLMASRADVFRTFSVFWGPGGSGSFLGEPRKGDFRQAMSSHWGRHHTSSRHHRCPADWGHCGCSC